MFILKNPLLKPIIYDKILYRPCICLFYKYIILNIEEKKAAKFQID